MRVLHVLPTRAPAYGGPVRVAEALVECARREGFDASLFPAGRTRPGPLFYPGARELTRLAAEVRRADLIHVHGLWTVPTTAAAALARALRKPYVLTPHGMLDRWSLARSRRRKRLYAAIAERANLRGAARLHFFNEEEAEQAAAFGPLPPHFLLPNGVDLGRYAALPDRDALDLRWPAAKGRPTLLFLGRIHPKKGFDILIPALTDVVRDHPAVLLLVAGPDEGGYRAEVERLLTKNGLEEHVLFTGEVEGEDKRTLLGGADLFVLPSHQEGDSVAIKEALASGLPVLITLPCHFREVEERGAGRVVPDQIAAVARALTELLSSSAARRDEQRQAARALAAGFDWSALGRRLAAEYRALLRQ